MHGIAADLDAGADAPELLRLLVDRDVDALEPERRGRRQPAHAGTDDGDVQFAFGHATDDAPIRRGDSTSMVTQLEPNHSHQPARPLRAPSPRRG